MSTTSEQDSVKVGDYAPNFTLSNQSGEEVNLWDIIGKSAVVLYFYPKDDTPGCTSEACAFRDSYEVFKDAGAEVIGVSSDSSDAHRRFAAKYHLPFILLSDKGGSIRRLYGVPWTLGLLPGRVTYIIDKYGVVRHIFDSQFAPQKHISEALETLRNLS